MAIFTIMDFEIFDVIDFFYYSISVFYLSLIVNICLNTHSASKYLQFEVSHDYVKTKNNFSRIFVKILKFLFLG